MKPILPKLWEGGKGRSTFFCTSYERRKELTSTILHWDIPCEILAKPISHMHAWKRSVMYTRCHFSNGLLGRNLVGWNIFLERIYYIHQVNLCSKISSLENQKGRPYIDNKNLSFSHIGRDKFFGKYPADLTQIPFRENLLHK